MEKKTIVAQELCQKKIAELIDKGFAIIGVNRTPEIFDFKIELTYIPATVNI